MKQCTNCRELKDFIEFGRDLSKKDGFCSICKSCRKVKNKNFYLKNKDKILERTKKYENNNKQKIKIRLHNYYVKNKNKILEKSLYYRKNNKEKISERGKNYYKNNKEKESLKNKKNYENNKEYYNRKNKERYKNNKEYFNSKFKENYLNKKSEYVARTAKRRACKLQATPKWLTKEQLNEIKEIYKNCPKGYHVDHIIPLQGKNVCGLHVPWNLQYLSKEENLKKSNKL